MKTETLEGIKIQQSAKITKALTGNSEICFRQPEKKEIFDDFESATYVDGCDFPETADYAIVAAEIVEKVGKDGRLDADLIAEICPGPGNLCGEMLALGAKKIIGIDGSEIMLDHAAEKFDQEISQGRMEFRQGMAQDIPLPDNSVDGIVNFNSFHQFADIDRALRALQEMVRVLKPNGWAFVRDFRRDINETKIKEWFTARQTKDEIIPLLEDSIKAAFTKDEFMKMLSQIPGIEFEVTDAEDPKRIRMLRKRINADPVRHETDFLVSQNIWVRKK